MKIRIPLGGITVQILIFGALICLTVLLIRPLQLRLFRGMESFRDSFIQGLEDQWGRSIQYGSMGPSIFGVMDVRDVEILREDQSSFLSISRIRLSYSFLALLRGKPLDAFHTIRIDQPVLSLDFAKDADLGERFSALTNGNGLNGSFNGSINGTREGQGITDLLPENFSLRIWNGQTQLAFQGGDIRLSSVGLEASVRQNRISFNGSWNAQGSLDGFSAPEAFLAALSYPAPELSMSGRVSGDYSEETREGRASVSIPSFSGALFALKPLSFDIFLAGDVLSIRKAHDGAPLALSLSYDQGQGLLQGQIEGDGFSPLDLVTFQGPLSDLNESLTMALGGRGSFSRYDTGALEYEVSFAGANGGARTGNESYLIIEASGTDERHDLENFLLSIAQGGLSFQGALYRPRLPPGAFAPLDVRGRLVFDNLRRQGEEGLRGAITIDTRGHDIYFTSPNFRSAQVHLETLSFALYQEPQGMGFSLEAQRAPDLNQGPGHLVLEGSVDYQGTNGQPQHTRARAALESFPLGDIFTFFEPLAAAPLVPPLIAFGAHDLILSTEVFLTINSRGQVFYRAPRILAVFEGLGTAYSMEAALAGTNRGFDLWQGRFSWTEGWADFSSRAEFANLDDIGFSLNAGLGDLHYLFEGRILDQRQLSLTSANGLDFLIEASGEGGFSGHAIGEAFPIPSGDRTGSLSFQISFVHESPYQWEAEIDLFDLSGMSTPGSSPGATSSGSLRFNGRANQEGLHIPGLVIDDGRGALVGDLHLQWDPYFNDFRFRADFMGVFHREYYRLAGTYQSGFLDLSFVGEDMQLGRFSPLEARSDASFRLYWDSPASFELDADISSLRLTHNREEYQASAELRMNGDSALLRRVQVSSPGLNASLPLLRIDRRDTMAEMDARIFGNLWGNPLEVALRLEAQFNPVETWVDLIRDFYALDISLHVDEARYDTMVSEPFSLVFASRRDRGGHHITLNGGPRNMVRFSYSPGQGDGSTQGGSFYASLSAPFPARGSIAGTLGGGYIDAQSRDLYVDMKSLWSFIPPSVDFIMFPEGIVSLDVRILGSIYDPEFYGTARANSLHIVIPQILAEPIRPVPTTIFLNGSEMTFGWVDAIVGAGAGTGYGWFRWDQWVPATFSIDVQVPFDTPIPYDMEIAGVLGQGQVSGRLNISMEEWILGLAGDLTVHNTEISLDAADFNMNPEEDDEDKLVYIRADINLRTGRRVEFFWPNADFPILQAYADMGSAIAISFDEESDRFSIMGDINLRSGELFYLERNFYLREGTLFFRENQNQFDPRISARAEIRDRIDSGPVIIAMIIDNAPLISFTPRFESNPPLSQVEIFSLLGHHPQGGPTDPQRNMAAAVAIDSIAHLTVVRRVQREIRDFLGVDMFSMRTQFFQNMLLQAAGTPPEEEDNIAPQPPRMGNYFDNSTVFIGKYFTPEVFGEAMLSFRHDPNYPDWGGLRLEPELGLELRNPLFDIRFQMVPLNQENWFISDTSISLIWRRSF
ncbi:MAG: translocation/assembly module TamB [Treponema sp.]|nr:translocation/assembly module TamB [Treponema sp.]